MTHLLLLLLCFVQYARPQQTLFPAAIPLAVRSPYFSCWDFTTNGKNIGNLWPTTAHPADSTTTNDLSIPVHVRVDNTTYSFVGGSNIVNGTVNLTSMVITPTQTKLTAKAGSMQSNLTFLNPIERGDLVKQSIPFSYLSLTAESLDGAGHAVQVYSDVSGEWLSGDRNQAMAWSTTNNSNLIYHWAALENPAEFTENYNQADWGTLYYAMKSASNITFKTDSEANCRGLFQQNGTLDNKTDLSGPRAISSDYPVLAISRDLGVIQATQSPVVWAVGFTTDPAIRYDDPSADAPQQRSLYYKTQYPADTSLIPDFLNNFANASSTAQRLDSEILGDAANVSGALGDLVSLSTAQLYGSIQLTVGYDASGNLNKSDVMAFMKNIGGPGSTTNRVNAVETLFSAFPAFMYIDPQLGGLLLEPLFRLQASPSYKAPYPVTDLGSNYPNVTIGNSHHNQRVEQSGNMLIMTYAHARASGDGGLISRYYSQLTSWANYLSNSTLYTADESSADGLSSSNQTNLAIKGIIAIAAMSKMSSVVNQAADADKYSNKASSLYSLWKGLALASDQHLVAIYGHPDTWTLGYNLFVDLWLNTSIVESSVYNAHSNFIDNITLSSSFSNYGMPVDNYNADANTAASSWTLFVAAMTSDQDLRTNLISRVHNRASLNSTPDVFPVLYDSTSGLISQGGASPAQGAMYAPLALNVPARQIAVNPVPSRASSKSRVGAIAGGAIGGGALLAIGIALVTQRQRRRNRRRKSIGSSFERDVIDIPDFPMTLTPFNATLNGTTELETGPETNWQQEHVEPETVPLVHSFPPSDSPALSSRVLPPPVRLSGKELARLREDNSRLQSTDALSPGPQLTTTAELGVATSSSDARRLQSEVESLWREMQQLRAERFEAPPLYDHEDEPGS